MAEYNRWWSALTVGSGTMSLDMMYLLMY